MRPDSLAGADVQANDGFLRAKLFLRIQAVANDDDGRPGRSDPALPEQFRRRCFPVRGDLDIVEYPIAVRPTKSRPIALSEIQAVSYIRQPGCVAFPFRRRAITILLGVRPAPTKRQLTVTFHSFSAKQQEGAPAQANGGSQKESAPSDRPLSYHDQSKGPSCQDDWQPRQNQERPEHFVPKQHCADASANADSDHEKPLRPRHPARDQHQTAKRRVASPSMPTSIRNPMNPSDRPSSVQRHTE